MPQFDILSFFVQILYVSAGFLFAYFMYLYFVLTRISEVIKARKKLLAHIKLLQQKNPNSWKRLYSAIIKYYK